MTRNDGRDFGLWPDPTSLTMYHDLMPQLLDGLDLRGPSVDLGGANGLLTQWIPGTLTVDINPDMDPDVVADALTWVPPTTPRFAVTRYTAHYWDDPTLDGFLRHVATYTERLVSIQIVTVDPVAKEAISARAGEPAWWRDLHLLTDAYQRAGWRAHSMRVSPRYTVVPEFYTHRLGFTPEQGHDEQVAMHDLRRV